MFRTEEIIDVKVEGEDFMFKLLKRIIPNKWRKKIKGIIKRKQYRQYKKQCRQNGQKEYILLETPIHGNLGDHAIVIAEYEMLKSCQIVPFEVPTFEAELCYSYLLKNIAKDAIILITGGGNIGSEWLREEKFIRKIIQDFKEHKIIVFPQTIYYKDDEVGREQKELDKQVYAQAKKLYLCTREEKSYELARQLFQKAEILLLPDIVLSLAPHIDEGKREGILLCIRNDAESNINEETKNNIRKVAEQFSTIVNNTDTVEKKKITKKIRKKELNQKLKEFSKYKLIITDRLHGMIFAALTRTPCIAIGNYNYKVKGVYQWIKDYPCIQYVETVQELQEKIGSLYDDNLVKDSINLQEKYQPLLQIIKGEKKKSE